MEWKLTLPGYSGLRHCSWRREVWNNHVFRTPWKVKAGAMNDGQPEKCKFVAAFHEVDHFKNYSLSLHLGSSLSKKAHFLEGNRFSWACAVAPSFLRSILSLSCHSFPIYLPGMYIHLSISSLFLPNIFVITFIHSLSIYSFNQSFIVHWT